MHSVDKRNRTCARRLFLIWSCCAFCATIAVPAFAASPSSADQSKWAREQRLRVEVNEALGLYDSEIVAVDVQAMVGQPFSAVVPLRGESMVIDFVPHSVRAPGYRLLAQAEDGTLVDQEPGPERTLRGTVDGDPDTVVAASLLDDGLYARVILSDDNEFWIEPVPFYLDATQPAQHVVYRHEDIIPSGASCGAEALEQPFVPRMPEGDDSGGTRDACGGGILCLAELACDADFQYFQDWGSVAAVENRINSVINGVNIQYERDVEITHAITAIVVRSSGNPSSYDSASTIEGLLSAFRSYWQSQHSDIPRDLAELFTGRNLSGSVIGIAWLSGVCNSFGYSVVESDCCGSYGCSTDLSAHEMGHNWSADHCSCPSYTMNSGLTCANQFHPTSTVPEVVSFRTGIQSCLDTPIPSNDNCENALSVVNGSFIGTTNNGTNDGSASCGNSSSTPDVWYVYTADANGILTVDTCDSSFDTVLSIHNFCPGTSANEIACEDDTCGQQSEVSISVTVGTAYVIRVSGSNGSVGDFVLNVNGPVDNDPPEPSPTTWVAEPYAVTESNVAMSVTPSSDAGSPPVEYYFSFVDVQIPGGHDSGWQSSNFYADGDLLTNYLYGYTGRVRDGQGNETDPAPLRTAATFIETPQLAPVVLTEDTIASLATTESFTNLTLGQSGLYFDCLTSGGDGGINEWVQMTSATAFDLTPDTDYTFRFKARNQDAVETDWSPTQTRRTKAAVPSAPVLSNATCASMDVAIGDDINPSYTTYAIHCTSTSPTDGTWEGLYVDASGSPTGSAVYQTQADWGTTTLLNMAELTTYGFEVIARNASGITTAPGPEASLTTESCGSGETCDDGILNQGEDRIDCGGPCPPCSCLSDGACSNGQYCDGVETCDAWGECQPGTSVDCDDGIACTVDSCNETTDQCNNLPDDALCDNGLFCDGAEWCDPAVGCEDGADPCGPEETCNEEQDVCESLPFCATLPDPAVCKGDVNGNGVVDPSDVGLVKFWYGDTDPASLCSYDVNCDGTINTSDVGLVKFYYGACAPESEAPCWAQP